MKTGNTDRGKGNNGKKRTAAAAIVVVLLIMLSGGTYAWFHMLEALNEWDGDEKSVTLHDDYDEEQVDAVESPDDTYNKDVYAENTGKEALFIRIRLDEYLEIMGEPQVSGTERDDYSKWITHEYDQADGGDIEDCGEIFHEWWEWELGGGAIEYTPATEQQKDGVADRYEGGTDHLTPGSGTEWTLPGNIKTMAAYMTGMTPEERTGYEGWVLDADGYAYWSQKLEPGKATGVLLSSVTMIKEFDLNYYYGIHVVLEAVDETDLGAWLNGDTIKEPLSGSGYEGYESGKAEAASASAKWLLRNISDNYLYMTEELKAAYPGLISATDGDGFVSGEALKAHKKEVVIKLEVEGTYKDTYAENETFDPDGMKVLATFMDGHQEEITDTDYTLDPDRTTPLTTDHEYITIRYREGTTTVDITVTVNP